MWIPNKTSPPAEEAMEKVNLPEDDRVEIRKMCEFLRRKEAKKRGEELPPMSPEMKSWLLGED